jgi:hypothetical protein
MNGKIKFELQLPYRNVPKEELLRDLKRVAKKLKKDSVTWNEYENTGKYSYSPFFRAFGSWTAAFKAAGLKRARTYRVSDRELFENLKDVWVKLGRQPKKYEMHSPQSKYTFDQYIYRFGNWTDALRKFVDLMKSGGLRKISPTENTVSQPKWHSTRRRVSATLKLLVLARDRFKCRLCARSPATDENVALQVDHIKPWSQGGETVLDNLQTLCSKCNLGKSNRTDNPHRLRKRGSHRRR